MNRIAGALLLSGVALLVSWAVAPAAPIAPPDTAAAIAAIEQSVPVVDEVNAQVDRLRERLAEPQKFPPPQRNPFDFGRHPEPARPVKPVVETPAVPVEPPPPPLPRLLAIVLNTVDGAAVHSAVFSNGDDVNILKAGDTIGRYVVRSVASDGAELVDRNTSRVFRVTLK
jgi:hypothetical protein